MQTKSSRYLLIFRDASPESYQAMLPAEREQLLQRWNAWYDGLLEQGKVQHGNPLEPEGRIVSGARGKRVVDGPFAEAKEVIGGYFLLTVDSLDEATGIAQQCPNLEHGMVIEVRPISEACHLAHSLGRKTMKALTTA